MYRIKLEKRAPGVDDRFIVTIGPRQLKTCGIWDGLVFAAPYNPIKLFKTEAAARRALAPWTTGDGLEPNQSLREAGFTRIEIIPA